MRPSPEATSQSQSCHRVRPTSSISERGKSHRIKCIKCGKRFGNDVNMWKLLIYQEKMQKVIYELLFTTTTLTTIAERWGITQQKLSQFKKSLVTQIFEQNSEIIEHQLKALPGGIMQGDETFLGSWGNSDVETVFINQDYETLSIGAVKEGELQESIMKTFKKIPNACREKLKVLITDGEPSYKSIAKLMGGKVIHVAQFHKHNKRGMVHINKFVKVGPHYFHYKIITHWKAFFQNKHELKFKWEIKFIKGKIYKKRGRPRKEERIKIMNKPWRQKVERYHSPSFQKIGIAKVFVNFDTNKISMRAGARKWMIRMLTPIYKIFKGKHITTNKIESKHAQVKGNGAGRKMRDGEYGHRLYMLHTYIVEYGYIPFTNLTGRPLFRYLMRESKKKRIGYKIMKNDRNHIQTVLSTYE
ncbi:MAG: hypothetical protein P8Y97_12195 [Candidatus Lokiarchaeota archaeon]